MNKRNPFLTFEKTMKVIGKILKWSFGILLGVFFLVFLPVVGIITGRVLEGFVAYWTVLGTVLVIIFIEVGYRPIHNWISNKYRNARYKWEEENR